MTTTEHQEWTTVRIRRLLQLHQYAYSGTAKVLSVDNAAAVCFQIVVAYDKRIEAIELAASQATNDMVAELMVLRAELAALWAANEAARQFQPLPRRVEIDLIGHVDD